MQKREGKKQRRIAMSTDLLGQEEALIVRLNNLEDRYWSARGLDAASKLQDKIKATLAALDHVRKLMEDEQLAQEGRRCQP